MWSEGPVWIRDGGFLLCSDTRTNIIWRWDAKDGFREFLTPSGYTGETPRGGEMGSNGLTLDQQRPAAALPTWRSPHRPAGYRSGTKHAAIHNLGRQV